MEYLLILIIIFSMSLQSICQKQYNIKTSNGGAYLFTSVSMLFAAMIFVIKSGGKFSFEKAIVPYVLAFAICFGTAIFFTFKAIGVGSMSFTSLATSYSLIIPTVSALFIYEEINSVGIYFYIGLAFLLVSLFLINNYKGENRFTAKWIVYVLLAFLGNGLCSTVQTYQQRIFKGMYKSELMITALVAVSLFFFVFSFFEGKNKKAYLKKGLVFMALYGIAIGVVNLLVMVLSTRMNVSVMYPLISAGGIVVTSLVSILFYKEKLTKTQYIGLFLGIVAVVFINL